MSLLHHIRRRLAELVLHGRLLDAWVSRKVRRLERQYQAELVNRSQAKPAKPPPRLKLKRDPRRILFISDCQWEDEELVPELEAICRVDTLNVHPALGSARRAVPPSQIVRTELAAYLSNHASAHPDVILFYARPELLSPEAFALLRHAYSCPIVGMNLDDKIQFLDYGLFAEQNDNYRKWAGYFDLNLTNVRAVVDWYSDAGFPVYYMPEGFHPKAEPLGAQPEYRHEMTFVGSWRAEREQLYRQLQSLRVPIEVFGRGWPSAPGVP